MKNVIFGLAALLVVACGGEGFSSNAQAGEAGEAGTSQAGSEAGGSSGEAGGDGASAGRSGSSTAGGTHGGDSGAAGNSAGGASGAGGTQEPQDGGVGDSGGAGDAGDVAEEDAGAPDCEAPTTYYLDHDADGFGGGITAEACELPQAVVPYESDDLTTGAWVTVGGDCYDGSDDVYPGATVGTSTPFPGVYGPSYDVNCNGLEEANINVEWVGAAQNCVFEGPYQCSGVAAHKNGNRSETDPGANDLCGGTLMVCLTNTSAGPCGAEPDPASWCK
jgi:hypothetical protein